MKLGHFLVCVWLCTVSTLLIADNRRPGQGPRTKPTARDLVATDNDVALRMAEKSKGYLRDSTGLGHIDKVEHDAIEAAEKVLRDPAAKEADKENARKEIAKRVWDAGERHQSLRNFIESADRSAETAQADAKQDVLATLAKQPSVDNQLGKVGIPAETVSKLSPNARDVLTNGKVANEAELGKTLGEISDSAKERKSTGESAMVGLLEAATLMSGGRNTEAVALKGQVKKDGKPVDSATLYGNVSVTVRTINEFADRLAYLLGSSNPALAKRFEKEYGEQRKQVANHPELKKYLEALEKQTAEVRKQLEAVSRAQAKLNMLDAKARRGELSEAEKKKRAEFEKERDEAMNKLSDAFILREAKVNQALEAIKKIPELSTMKDQIEKGEFLDHEFTDADVERMFGKEIDLMLKGNRDPKAREKKVEEYKEFLRRCQCSKAKSRGCSRGNTVSRGNSQRPLDFDNHGRNKDERI